MTMSITATASSSAPTFGYFLAAVGYTYVFSKCMNVYGPVGYAQ